MATTHGARCAALLIALDLPFEAVVRGLEQELGLTRDEATMTALGAARARAAA